MTDDEMTVFTICCWASLTVLVAIGFMWVIHWCYWFKHTGGNEMPPFPMKIPALMVLAIPFVYLILTIFVG